MLFDKIERTYKGIKLYSESDFDYLNRSARKYCERMRSLLEEWLGHYPIDEREELIKRFRSSDDINFKSAFFELYLHELLLRLGFKIEIHPQIAGESTHPEFLASLDTKSKFYLEATLSVGHIEEVAAEKRENIVYDTLDKMDSPNFFIGVKIEGLPKTPPPGAKWRLFLAKELSKLDPDELATRLKEGGLESMPKWTMNHDGWNITFQPIPKSPQARGKKGIRPLGLRFFGFSLSKDHIYIRNAIRDKSTKYGTLNLPYIVAVNILSIFSNDISIKDALFGEEVITAFQKGDGTFNYKPGRKHNGAWWGPRGPQNTRVSGVMTFAYLAQRNIPQVNPILWHNPWAKQPLNPDIWPLPQRIINKQKGILELKEGKRVAEVFNLPENWPIIDGDDD